MSDLDERQVDVDPEPSLAGVAATVLTSLPAIQGESPAAVYGYEDEAGELLFAVGRYELEDGKTFRQARLVEGRWQFSLDGVRRVLYRLPAVLDHIARNAREPLFVVEGEKDVHAIEAAGGVATCNPMGAGKWSDAYAEQLQGARRVIVVADRDEIGRHHAAQVAESLAGVGIVAELAEAAEGKDVADHLAAGHSLPQLVPLELETPDEPHVTRTPQLVSLQAFVDSREEQAQALLGDDEDTFLARGGLGITGGVGGSTKTTLAIDMVAHLAAGIPWLGIPVPRSLRVALIENEGSRAKFRDKLRQKVDSWEGPAFADNVLVLDEPWTAFSFADRTHRRALREQCVDAGVELVVANPLGNLGVDGVGSPEETEAFMRHLRECGLDRDLAFWLIHHFNRGGHRDILHRLSGAWDRHADTIIGVEREGTRRTKLTWAKTRWATPPEDKTTILEWHVPTRGFTLVDTSHDDTEEAADEILAKVIFWVAEHPGGSTKDVREGVGGKATAVDRALTRGTTNGQLVLGPGRAHNGKYYYPAPQALFSSSDDQGTTGTTTPAGSPPYASVVRSSPAPIGDDRQDDRADAPSEQELNRLLEDHADIATGAVE